MPFRSRLRRKLFGWIVRPLLQDHLLNTPIVIGEHSRLRVARSAKVNNAVFNLASGTISVEEDVFFGHNVLILTGSHDYTMVGAERATTIPASGRDIVIERGAWVASGAIILGPCHIAEHSIVAAGAVVTRDVPAHAIVAGVPARVIGSIDQLARAHWS